jgi:uroporphyrinogen-III synthase
MKKTASNTQGEKKPLAGYRILITRAARQSGALSGPLTELGAQVIAIPTIEIAPPGSYARLDAALANHRKYDWLILTSVNGVEAMFARLGKLRIAPAKLQHFKVAAIGPATRDEIERRGLKVLVTPEKYIAEAVVQALQAKTKGKRVLLVRAKVARDVLPNELRKAGAKVDVVDAYETKVPAGAKAKLNRLFAVESTQPHIVTFTSSSTATNFLNLLEKEHYEALRGILLASIGPVTSATLEQAGFKLSVEAKEYTMEGLVEAIAEYVH